MPRTSSLAPKYAQLATSFRKQIEKGDLRPGDRLPSYVEMHRLHSVSRPTMDKALDLLEADGAIVREPGRGVFVARPKAPMSHGVIGLLGGVGRAQERHPYFAHILEGVHEVADREGIEILLLSQASVIAWEKVDGVLTSGVQPEDELHRLPPGMPYVRLLMPSPDGCSVVADDERGAREATQYLLSLGHRRIAYLSSTLTQPISRQRHNGYLQALRAGGIKPHKNWTREIFFVPGPSRGSYLERSEDMMRQWLQDDWESLGCTAILTANDDAAIGVMQALREAGVLVPGDVSVVGFDGTDVSRYASPRLTTIEVPLREISALGTQLLLRQMGLRLEAPKPKVETVVLPPRLVVRESTAPPPSLSR